ncbi:MAG: response regulator transcription factor [Saprospiraceae bacterium]
MPNAHLLYVEDDESLSFVTRDHLELHGYRVTHFINGRDALEAFGKEDFDLCLLDVMLPGMDGFELARRIRETDHEVPILFLTARVMKDDRIEGLRLGGDDYITKPFSIEELLLRIEVFLRRSRIAAVETPPADDPSLGDYEFDFENLQLLHQPTSTTRRLTLREAQLLRLLAGRRNRVLERSAILEEIWGENDYFMGRSLDVFISRLRKYLKRDDRLQIENIHGVGFCFHAPSGE